MLAGIWCCSRYLERSSSMLCRCLFPCHREPLDHYPTESRGDHMNKRLCEGLMALSSSFLSQSHDLAEVVPHYRRLTSTINVTWIIASYLPINHFNFFLTILEPTIKVFPPTFKHPFHSYHGVLHQIPRRPSTRLL